MLAALQKDVFGEMRSRRDKGKHNYYENFPEEEGEERKEPPPKNKVYKKAELPEYQFF
jgi:hypothetical protein